MVLLCSARRLLRPLTTVAAVLLVAGSASAVRAAGFVKITGMAYEASRHSLVLDIDGPVTISTASLKAPPRLVVDVPTATLLAGNRELVVKDAFVQRVRIAQFRIFPPVVRIVIETATDKEPLIAVQQTEHKLYITLAKARPLESPKPAPSASAPAPTPTPRPVAAPTPRPAAIPTPAPVERPTPVPMRTPRAIATPRPALHPTPHPRPVPSPVELLPPESTRPAPKGEKRGEAGRETLPQLP